MKKLYFSFLLIAVSFISRAQITQGTILLGGALSFSNTSDNLSTDGTASPTDKANQFGISPSFGKAVRDNLVLGFDLDFGYANGTYNPNSHENDYGAGVFVRKYKYLGSKFYLFGQSRLGFAYTNQTQDYPSSNYTEHIDFKQTEMALSFVPGLAYNIDKRWQVELVLPALFYIDYMHTIQDQTYSTNPIVSQHTESNRFDLSSDLSATALNNLQIGVHYMIGGK